MKTLALLLPADCLTHPEKHRELSAVALVGYQALWHPALLANADGPPRRLELGKVPEGEELCLAVPKVAFDVAPELVRTDLQEAKGALLSIVPEHLASDGPERLLAAIGLASVDAEVAADFFALGFAEYCLDVLLTCMGHSNPLDRNSLMADARRAAESALRGENESAREALQAAFDQLLAVRQTVYPATINVIDLALCLPAMTVSAIDDRLRRQAPLNLLISGSQLDELAKRDGELAERLRSAVANSTIEVVGGMYDERPLTLLSAESRNWQLQRAADAYNAHLGRDVDCFGSRSLAMTPDLPQLLMKFQYRYALHLAFDGGRFPLFRDPKLHWTAADGSVIESLCRAPIDAGDPAACVAALAALGRSLMEDRSATLVLTHWFGHVAPWLCSMLRVNEFVPLFGKFETISDFFMNSSLPDKPTHTEADEYQSRALAASHGTADPISRWVNHHRLRGEFDAVRSLAGLLQMVDPQPLAESPDLESAVEIGEAGCRDRLAEEHKSVLARLSAATLHDAGQIAGFLLYNPCNFGRRACLEIDGLSPQIAVERPIRAVQPNGRNTAIVVDVPGWGFVWLPKSASDTTASSEKAPPLASGRRLRNEFIEAEIDQRTGGVRGVWEARSGYSRIGQQLVHSRGSVSVLKKMEITASGPAFGEIQTTGHLIALDNKTVLAEFRQRTRLWLSKPFIEIAIELEPKLELTGDPREDYFACRWAWPDEKTVVSSASGFQIQPNPGERIESPLLLQLRERKMTTDIIMGGLPFHRRNAARMLDTLLITAGESRRRFDFTIAMDLANPWAGVLDCWWPVGIAAVENGPPKSGKSGWLPRINSGNVICSRLAPIEDYRPGVRFRFHEVAGATARTELRLCRRVDTARLTNCRGQLIFDLYPTDDGMPVDFSPHELLQVEVLFEGAVPPPAPADPGTARETYGYDETYSNPDMTDT